MSRRLIGTIVAFALAALGLAGCAGVVSSNSGGNPSAPVAPTIATQPANQTVTAGRAATFAVVASGTAPVTYQWKRNGGNITGATSASYTTPATTTADSGSTFQVAVSNTAGNATSNAATLTVSAAAVAPTIATQPANQTVTAGQAATFSVVASGTVPLTYQWKRNGGNITGATSASFTTPATTTADTGSTFQVAVSNAAGSATSAAATLSVNPDSTAPTVSITAPASGATVSATITVTATASDSIGVVGVQFQVDGVNTGAEDSLAPYTFSLDTTTLSNNTHALTAVARDAAGNQATSAAVMVAVANTVSTGATGPLRVLASNPRYFTDGSGRAIYLAGSHTWANLVDQGTTDPPAVFDYTAYLNFLVAHNHNFFRLWTWTLPHANDAERPFSTPLPWLRVGPGIASDGKPQFDLNQFDPTYFSRLRSRVAAAQQQGIYVSIMLFEGYDLQFMTQSNDGDPFASGNNVNGISCGGTCPHTLPQDAAVTAIEQAYLRKVVDTVNDLDNVLYEVANEAGAPYSTSWQYSIITYVNQYEATKPKQHPSGMTFQYSGGSDSNLASSPADWISPGTQLPPAADGRKVVVNDSDHSYFWTGLKSDGQAAQQAWVWKNFTLGNNVLFMDPYLVVWPGRNAPGATTVDPYWEVMRNALGRTRIYAQKMNLAGMTPQASLCSTGYCLASTGSEYLIYQPSSGASFNVSLSAGTYSYEWYNPSLGSIAATGLVTATSGNLPFTAPFNGDAVLYLKIQ